MNACLKCGTIPSKGIRHSCIVDERGPKALEAIREWCEWYESIGIEKYDFTDWHIKFRHVLDPDVYF